MEKTLVAVSGSSWLVGVDSGNQDQPVLYLFLYLGQPGHVLAYRVFPISGAGADDNEEFIALSCKNVLDGLVLFCFFCCQSGSQRKLRPDLVWSRKMCIRDSPEGGRCLYSDN